MPSGGGIHAINSAHPEPFSDPALARPPPSAPVQHHLAALPRAHRGKAGLELRHLEAMRDHAAHLKPPEVQRMSGNGQESRCPRDGSPCCPLAVSAYKSSAPLHVQGALPGAILFARRAFETVTRQRQPHGAVAQGHRLFDADDLDARHGGVEPRQELLRSPIFFWFLFALFSHFRQPCLIPAPLLSHRDNTKALLWVLCIKAFP